VLLLLLLLLLLIVCEPFLLAVVLQAEKQSRPMFQTFVSFEPNEGMSFTPDERAVLNELNDNTMEGVVAVAQVGPGTVGQPAPVCCTLCQALAQQGLVQAPELFFGISHAQPICTLLATALRHLGPQLHAYKAAARA
jgi:hypothetical protein